MGRYSSEKNSLMKGGALTVIAVILMIVLAMSSLLVSCGGKKEGAGEKTGEKSAYEKLTEDGEYYSKDEVAAYLTKFGHLPSNFITKKEARELGWRGGSVEKYAEGKAIGGDRFGNREKKLPVKSGRNYYECDIDTRGRPERGPKRLVYSDEGLIFYTEDHYNTFEEVKVEE